MSAGNPNANAFGVQTNGTDYPYYNPLPGTTSGASVCGYTDEVVVVTSGPYVAASNPFRADNGISPMESGMFDENPAWNPATQTYLQGEQEEGQPTVLQDGLLAPNDGPVADDPGHIEDLGDTGPDVLPTPQG
jgi:hypothetical protein